MCSEFSRTLRILRNDAPRSAVAEAIAMCRPALISAYPDAPQSRILESLDEIAKAGRLANCEIIDVASDIAAMSVAIGAAAAGRRTYTATSSQGLLRMAEPVFNAAGSGLPIVMTIVDSATEARANTWSDHTDSMSMRDAGWIQLYAETHQEALDLHVQAFRLAEALSCPVMVCVEGLVIARFDNRIDVPTHEQVDAYLPRFETRRAAGTVSPAFTRVGSAPDTFTEMLYLSHHKQLRALGAIAQLASEFLAQFGRPAGGLMRSYRTEDAETIVVALGSVNGTIRNVVDELRAEGARIGSVAVCSFRPFPLSALRGVLQSAKRVVILERSLAVGLGGILSDGVSKCAAGSVLNAYSVIAGLGGRAITRASLKQLFEDAARDELGHLTFLDLNADIVASQLEREATTCSFNSEKQEF